MTGTKYVVRDGDTLWDLARDHLGDPLKWPLIYEHNNSPPVVTLTRTRIVDPDLIFVGQVIYIPNGDSRIPSQPTAPGGSQGPSQPAAPSGQQRPNSGTRSARRTVYSIPFKYSLSNLPTINIISPTHVATMKLTGSVTIQSEKPLDFITFTRDELEIKAKAEADLAFQKLISDAKVSWNPQTRQVQFEIGFTIHSNNKYAPSASASLGLSSTGLPSAKTSIKAPPIRGKVLEHVYVTNDLGFEIEITARPPSGQQRRPEPQRVPGVVYLVAAAVVATIIVTATIAEDVVTLGAGLADDPVSFAAASAVLAVGINRAKNVSGTSPIRVQGGGRLPPNQ